MRCLSPLARVWLLAPLLCVACEHPLPTRPSLPFTAVGPPRIEIVYRGLGPAFPGLVSDPNITVSVWGDLTSLLEHPLSAGDTLEGGWIVVVEYACGFDTAGCRPRRHRHPYGAGVLRGTEDGQTSISTMLRYFSLTVDLELSAETAHGAVIRLRPTTDHLRPAGRYVSENGRIRTVNGPY